MYVPGFFRLIVFRFAEMDSVIMRFCVIQKLLSGLYGAAVRWSTEVRAARDVPASISQPFISHGCFHSSAND